MTQDVDAIVKEALATFAGINDASQLEQAKARYLGRAGALTQLLKSLSKVVDGTPKVATFEVANSTSHQIAAKAA